MNIFKFKNAIMFVVISAAPLICASSPNISTIKSSEQKEKAENSPYPHLANQIKVLLKAPKLIDDPLPLACQCQDKIQKESITLFPKLAATSAHTDFKALDSFYDPNQEAEALTPRTVEKIKSFETMPFKLLRKHKALLIQLHPALQQAFDDFEKEEKKLREIADETNVLISAISSAAPLFKDKFLE